MVTTVAGDDRDLRSREVVGAIETARAPHVFEQRVTRTGVPDHRDHFDLFGSERGGHVTPQLLSGEISAMNQ
jgi:hypothetical protein